MNDVTNTAPAAEGEFCSLPLRTQVVPTCTTRLWLITIVFFGPQVIGSLFNIWYNLLHIDPLLTDSQLARFQTGIVWVNATLYPIATAIGLSIIWSLQSVLKNVCNGRAVSCARLDWARARAINLPWWVLSIATIGWLTSIPLFLAILATSPEPLDPRVYL
ncbi:MAG: hypothetical protein B7Z55_16520, partial [Planctomycetales bacterium 12-60-4]